MQSQQLRRQSDALLAGQRVEFLAQRGAGTSGEGGSDRGSGLRRTLAGGMERTAFATGRATAAEGLEVANGRDVVTGHRLIGVEHGLGAIEPLGGATEDGFRVGSHREAGGTAVA